VLLLIKKIDDDGRLSLLSRYLDPAWNIEVVDTDNLAEFDEGLARADAIVSMNWKWNRPAATHLKLVQLPGAGTDEIDFSLIPKSTAVCNCFEHEIGISEYVLAGMLEWTIRIRDLDPQFRGGSWAGSYLCGPRHGELFGKTVGIVGYGRIGREVARRAKAFGMNILACTRTPQQNDEFVETVWDMQRFSELLGGSDFVVVTPPLNEQTRGLFDESALRRMRPSAVIINVARGTIVDEAALYHALKEKRIAGAIIDVWYRYPPQGEPNGPRPSSFPFEELHNVIMTPHVSAWTDALLPRRNQAVAANMNRLARGEPLINVVKPAPEEK
jgi:phosphoglycerate dehydrogenase-like enzyme